VLGEILEGMLGDWICGWAFFEISACPRFRRVPGFEFADDRDYVVADANSVYGGSKNWGEVDGRTYISNVEFIAVKGRGTVSVGRMTQAKWNEFRDNSCRIAGAWTDLANQEILFAPTRMTRLSVLSNNTGAHEMGHFLGFSHVPKYIDGLGALFPPRHPSYMGYGARAESAIDIRNFANAYRR